MPFSKLSLHKKILDLPGKYVVVEHWDKCGVGG
jgi:hypothetical protein